MNLARNIGLGLILLSAMVLGGGLLLINHYAADTEPPLIANADWKQIEEQVEKDIGLIGYQFLARGGIIPAIEPGDYENCLNTYAELRQANGNLSREYLLKYNQIVYIRMLRAGVSCRE